MTGRAWILIIRIWYETFTAKRKELLALTHKAAEILHDLAIPSQVDIVPKIEKRIESDSFKVLVIGEFNSGKSTLVNAMLGRSILPTYAVETTAIINEIKWGEHPHAVVHEKGTGKAIKVSIDELEQFVVVGELQRERPEAAMRESSYDKAEIFWPLQLCCNGVEIIDSPGLNAHELREKISVEYLAKVDAVVFVMTAGRLAAASELKVIDSIVRPAGHQDIFFVCNRIDELRTERDREMVRRAGVEKLAGRTKLGARRIFFINALDKCSRRSRRPLLETQVKALINDIGPRADVLLSEIDQLRAETISPGTEIRADATSVPMTSPSVTERVIAGIGGLLFLDVGSEVLGGAFGYSGLLRSILPQSAIVIAGFALGLGPIVIIAASLLGAGFQAKNRIREANEKIKERFASHASEEMAKSRVDQAKVISADALAQMATIRDAIDRELAVQIASVKEQFDVARAEHQKGQQSVDAKLAALAAQRQNLDEIEGPLDDILQKITSFDQQAVAAQ